MPDETQTTSEPVSEQQPAEQQPAEQQPAEQEAAKPEATEQIAEPSNEPTAEARAASDIKDAPSSTS